MDDSEHRVTHWEQRTEWPLAGLAGLFLAVYAWPILDEQLSAGWHHACDLTSYLIWAVFAVDYLIRVTLATNRRRYVLHHLLDLVIIALPILRPLRLLRLVMLLKVLNRGATDTLRGRIAIYVTGSTVLLVICAALAVLDAERHKPGANISTFGDALWWAISTITTVGYGDKFPVTTQGRFIAVGLMIGGIALLGVVTASIASWLIDRVRAEDEAAQTATRSDIATLSKKVDLLHQEIRAISDLLRPVRDEVTNS